MAESNISSMDDIQNLFKETIAESMEDGLETELDDELGYSRYDYCNKNTENSRDGCGACYSFMSRLRWERSLVLRW